MSLIDSNKSKLKYLFKNFNSPSVSNHIFNSSNFLNLNFKFYIISFDKYTK